MLLGLDFDNTIVCYDQVFHLVASERGLVDNTIPQSKLAVRDHLRAIDREDDWTELQGYVYGRRMDDAQPYPGAIEVIRWARRSANLKLCIVSHKTQHPFMGPKYDLHQAAREWIAGKLTDELGPLVEKDDVHFCATKDSKVERIAELACDVFVDDLPEIFALEHFPESTGQVLFDPDQHHGGFDAAHKVRAWSQLRSHLATLIRA
ncbi:MAG: haloacid dehalogenase-like hydrolase [Pseudomonadota bacterium]